MTRQGLWRTRAKLTPYINIYSSSRAQRRQTGTTLSKEAMEFFKMVDMVLNKYPEKWGKFEKSYLNRRIAMF